MLKKIKPRITQVRNKNLKYKVKPKKKVRRLRNRRGGRINFNDSDTSFGRL
jgi:hypothetical protein